MCDCRTSKRAGLRLTLLDAGVDHGAAPSSRKTSGRGLSFTAISLRQWTPGVVSSSARLKLTARKVTGISLLTVSSAR